jgi:molybdenum transport protein
MSAIRCCLSDTELFDLLQEDVPYGDLTVDSLAIGERAGRITFQARDAMVVCGVEEAARLLELAGAEVARQATSGQWCESATPLLSASGPAAALFSAWKVAQSLMESLSGVSSLAHRIVSLAGSARVACTRKHLPGNKALMVKAVQAGGAAMHRYGLSDSIMVTAEHRTFLHADELSRYLSELQQQQPEKKIVVEVDEVEAALALVRQGCQVIQLEKLSPQQLAQVVAAVDSDQPPAWRPVIAAAGGVNAENVADYVAAGAEVVVTSAPYFAKPRDVQVRFYPMS